MSHIQGVVSAVFDNRTYKGQPNKFPYWKIMIGDSEFNAYTSNEINVKKGDNVSLHFGVSKKSGKTYVESDYETKALKLQVIPQGQPIPTEEIPLDDNLEPDHVANAGVVDNSKTSFNHGDNVKISPNVDKKSIEIFCIAMTKSALESNQLKAEQTSIDNFISDMINIYQKRFK